MVTKTSFGSKRNTYTVEGSGVISNRLYSKVRILGWSRSNIFLVGEELERDNRWAVPD